MGKNWLKIVDNVFATKFATPYLPCSKLLKMAKDKTTLRFWLRADRLNSDGTAPVHLVYQIKGQRKYYSIPNIKLLPINWNSNDQVAIYVDRKKVKKIEPPVDQEMLLTGHDVEEINTKLASVITEVRNIEKRFKLDQIPFSASMVIDALKEVKQPETKKDLPGKSVVDFINRYVKETSSFEEGTIKGYVGVRNHIEDFEKEQKQYFYFDRIDVPLMKSFQNYLLEKKEIRMKNGKKRNGHINNITVAKILNTLKTLLRRAEGEYDIDVNPKYKNFKNPHPRRDSELEVIALTQDEFMAVWELDLSTNKRLDEARDIFCFSIATGLRYGDLLQLNRSHIKKDNTIKMESSDKNSKRVDIPLNPISFAIIQKYSNRHKPLPVNAKGSIISDQKLNDYIKEVGKLAGIDEPIEKIRERGTKKISVTKKKCEWLSIHTGRKTFTTLSLEKGIPLQDVMSLTTHSTFAAVKRYINVTKERKKTVMAEAWGSVNPLKVAK
jgi:integrase